MPTDRGTTPGLRWRASWLAAATVLVVAGAFGLMTWLTLGSHDSSAARTATVITAPTSTASTPSVEAEAPALLGPALQARVLTDRARCRVERAPVLRVLQFNIRAGMSGRGQVDLPQIAAEIEAVRPDLVSLNEVDSDTSRTHVDEPAYLAGATGLHVVYGPNLIYDGGPFGNAILTRHPVVGSRNLRLPGTPGLEPRGLLTVVVSVGGRRVAFASTHLSDGVDGRRSRLLQSLAVAHALRSVTAPTILAGDLNSGPAQAPARILRQGLLDAQAEAGTGPGDTYPQSSPISTFDYILYDRRLAAVPGSTRVLASRSSDHRSVFTELTLLTDHGC